MKNICWSIVLLACIATANAQDTIFSTNLQENYYDFGKKWPTSWGVQSYTHISGRYTYILAQYNVEKPTKVYGVAAVIDGNQYNDLCDYLNWGDTIKQQIVCENGIETYAVFEANPACAQKVPHHGALFGTAPITSEEAPIVLCSDTVQVDEWADPPTAYFCFDDSVANWFHMNWFGYDKLFEVYFDEPVIVDDSFYVGRSGRSIYYFPEHKLYEYSGHALLFATAPKYSRYVIYHENDYFWSFKMTKDDHRYLFPILTPKPDPVDTTSNVDTTIVDTTIVDTTLRIDHKGFLQRYVSVQPNPASTSTTILSSFSILGIDAYATNGELVQHWEGEGLTTTLDVGTLPKGVYVLRITTAIGNVNKRLVVQ